MSPQSLSALWLSVKVSMVATLLVALIGIPLAYVLARRRFWGRAAVDTLVTLPLILLLLMFLVNWALTWIQQGRRG